MSWCLDYLIIMQNLHRYSKCCHWDDLLCLTLNLSCFFAIEKSKYLSSEFLFSFSILLSTYYAVNWTYCHLIASKSIHMYYAHLNKFLCLAQGGTRRGRWWNNRKSSLASTQGCRGRGNEERPIDSTYCCQPTIRL